MGRRKRKHEHGGEATPAPVKARLEPFVCAHCGSPQPVGDREQVKCRACGKDSPLPESYRHMREAHRLSADDAAQLDALCKDISRPPPLWERIAVVIGYLVGGITVLVIAIGALIGAIGGFFLAAKVDAGETVVKIFIGIGIAVFGFISVPFVGEWLIAYLGSHLDTVAAGDVIVASRLQWKSDLGVAAILYFLGVVPIALAWRTSQSISKLDELQAQLAAQPPATPDGVTACRRCGAPLEVQPGHLATRCIYCSADNLLSVPNAYAAKKKDDAKAIDLQVQAAVRDREMTKRDDRKTMWTLLAVGLLTAPLVCAGGWLWHSVFGQR